MRTTAKQHELIALIDASDTSRNLQLGVGRWVLSVGRCSSVYPTWIVFDASGMTNSIATNAQLRPSIDIVRLLHANQIEQPESWSDKRSKLVKSLLGSWRQTRVHKHERDFPGVSFGGEIWPNFSFGQNDLGRSNHAKGSMHDRPKIERRVYHLYPRRGIRCGKGKSGRGGGG